MCLYALLCVCTVIEARLLKSTLVGVSMCVLYASTHVSWYSRIAVILRRLYEAVTCCSFCVLHCALLVCPCLIVFSVTIQHYFIVPRPHTMAAIL
jgi:hypothetical protein